MERHKPLHRLNGIYESLIGNLETLSIDGELKEKSPNEVAERFKSPTVNGTMGFNVIFLFIEFDYFINHHVIKLY